MKKIIALILSVFVSVPSFAVGGAPPVQDKYEGGSGTALSTAFVSNVTANNTLVVYIGQASDSWALTAAPSNSCGDTFTEASNSPVTGTGLRIRAYTTRTSGGCASITLNSTVSAPFGVWLGEYNNMADSGLVECVASGTGNSTALLTGNCVTTSAETTLVAFGHMPVDTVTFTEGSGYTIEHQAGGTGHSEVAEDKNVSSAGTYTGSATAGTSGQWGIHVMALKNATQPSAGGGSIITLPGTGSITTLPGTGSITTLR